MKKLNSETKNHIREKEMGKMTNEELRIMFDVIVDGFDPSDSISVENANYELHKHWRSFLEAGFDADSVIKMMLPDDVWHYYDELVAYGAKIDMTELLSSVLDSCLIDDDYIEEHWLELISRGISPDALADLYYDGYIVFQTADLERLIDKGISITKVLELIEDCLESCDDLPEEQIEMLTWLYDHGLPKADVKKWLEQHAGNCMEGYIVETGSDFYKKFDMDEDAAIDRWLDRYGHLFFCDEYLSDLPTTISVDKLISFFPMKEIIDSCSPYGFDSFITDYLEAGKDINNLAQKFMDEIGYSSDSTFSGAMLDLVYAGASADIIDPAKYIELVDANQLDDCEANNWYDYFEGKGYDSQLISKFLR